MLIDKWKREKVLNKNAIDNRNTNYGKVMVSETVTRMNNHKKNNKNNKNSCNHIFNSNMYSIQWNDAGVEK